MTVRGVTGPIGLLLCTFRRGGRTVRRGGRAAGTSAVGLLVCTRSVRRAVGAAAAGVVCAGCTVWAGGGVVRWPPGPPTLSAIEEAAADGRVDEAVAAYEAHVERRLADPSRPSWENPYFHYLSIGDLRLRQGRPEEALRAYQTARRGGVDTALVSDRYRGLARWFEEKGDVSTAYELLLANKELDPLLFEARLDGLAREMVRREDEKEAASGGSGAPRTGPGNGR